MAPSNNNLRGFLTGGAGVINAGLRVYQDIEHKTRESNAHIDVPVFAAGFPMMMLSDTPAMLSVFPRADASNK
jgi:hypothetical protein